MGLAALILASLHSIVDFSLQIPGVGVYFAAIMAATVTVSLGRGGGRSGPRKRDRRLGGGRGVCEPLCDAEFPASNQLARKIAELPSD